MTKRQPIAFLSYVSFDDEHDNGRLTQFRERLSAEVRMQTGEEFPIFQDRNDIEWGQNWKERVEESIDEVTFLIPIITPSFFKSQACRDELKRFLEREKKLKRNDLILPVYYVGCQLLDDEAKLATDELAQVIAARQYADWRDLRFEPFTSPQVGKTLAQLAVQIRNAIERAPSKDKGQVRAEVPSPATAARELTTPLPEFVSESVKVARRPSAKTEPPTHIVDSMHRGDYSTIMEAIQAANPGDRILVRPGLYREGLVIDKPLEIIGEGDAREIIVEATGKNTLMFMTTMGRVVNLSLRQRDGDWYGVIITQGCLELEGCDITSQGGLACVLICGGADPRLRRNRIHNGKLGIVVYENSQGTLEDNDIFSNTLLGVAISTGSNPTLRRNRIHDSETGVFILENCQGTLEDNDIFGNAGVGVAITRGGNPTLRRNRIHDSESFGVFVWNNGQGTLEDNDIFGNAVAGVAITTGGNPTLRRNRIHDGKQGGVFVYENGQGTLEDNDIFGNADVGVAIKTGSNPTLRRNRINKNAGPAVWVYDGGAGTIEDNDLRNNTEGAWNVSPNSEPKLKRARNLE